MPKGKNKFALYMTPETQAMVREMFPQDNCRSQSEYIEKAIRFYTGYLKTQDSTTFLTEVLVSSLQGAIADSEMHIKRMLFKLSTELGLLTRIVASYEGLDANGLHSLRGQVVDDLKHTNGTLQLDEAVRRHQAGR